MKSTVLIVLFAVVLFSQSVLAGPMAQIPEATFNFGKISQHVKISKTFWVKSIGDDTLKILTIVPGCGCTQIPMKDSVLAPGDSSSFEVQFSAQAYRGFITKKPYITTNAGPDNIYLEFNAEIIVDSTLFKPIRLNPFKLDVSQFTVESRRKTSGWIINTSEKDLQLKMIDDKNKNFTVALPKIIKAHDSAQATVTVNEDAITKEFEQSVTFEVNDETASRFSLPVQRIYRQPQPAADKPK